MSLQFIVGTYFALTAVIVLLIWKLSLLKDEIRKGKTYLRKAKDESWYWEKRYTERALLYPTESEKRIQDAILVIFRELYPRKL